MVYYNILLKRGEKMKKFISILFSFALILSLIQPAAAATGLGSFNLTFLSANYVGNSLTLESVIANTGNATLSNVSFLEIDIFDKNRNYVDGTTLVDDPWLTNMMLEPGESTKWTLTIHEFPDADLSSFGSEYTADFISGEAEFTSGIKIVINNEYLKESQKATIQKGTTMVPMRAIFESLGADVKWNQATKTITATKGNDKLVLKIGAKYLTINGNKIPFDVPAKVVDNSTLVPLRVVSESFDGVVSYGKTGKATTISITTY